MTERLAVWSSHKPWLALAGWALALIVAIAVNGAFLGSLPSWLGWLPDVQVEGAAPAGAKAR